MRARFRVGQPQAEAPPERALIAAMLAGALRDAAPARSERRSATHHQAQAQARRWIESSSTAPGSFLWCCLWLDLDPGRVRAALGP